MFETTRGLTPSLWTEDERLSTSFTEDMADTLDNALESDRASMLPDVGI